MTSQDYPASQQFRYQRWDATGTLAFWTPILNSSSTSAVIVLTGLNISSNLGGTFQISQGFAVNTSNLVGEYFVAASATISPRIFSIFGTARGAIYWGRPSVSGTNGWTVLATGYEEV